MKILLSAPIYPPAIGGPAQYAKKLADALRKKGHTVFVSSFTKELKLPTGVRHLSYFFKIFYQAFRSDVILALDTYSVAFPSVWAAILLRKKIVIRTGGDFLWEQYVERTGEKILFSQFYLSSRKFSLKEHIIFRLTKFILHHTDVLVFSTPWQELVWKEPYKLSGVPHVRIIENFYGERENTRKPSEKRFVAGVRPLVWKNIDTLERAFGTARRKDSSLILDTANLPYDIFMEKIKEAYAVILVSLGDISPNMILDAIRYNKPFILTKENGLSSRTGDLGILVDPLDQQGIAEAILDLSRDEVYERECAKLRAFNFVHTYDDIAEEFIGIFKMIV